METFYINRYVVEVEAENAKAGDPVNVYIHARNTKQYKSVYRLSWSFGDAAVDLARRAMNYYTTGLKPDKFAGIVDETGCARYTMKMDQLEALYRNLEKFVADCTQEEYNENKDSIVAVYSLIHKHINNERNDTY